MSEQPSKKQNSWEYLYKVADILRKHEHYAEADEVSQIAHDIKYSADRIKNAVDQMYWKYPY